MHMLSHVIGRPVLTPACAATCATVALASGKQGHAALMSEQAAGSSLLAKLTCVLAADALRVAGLQEVGAVAVLPLATGMALTVTLLALKARRPPQAKCVLPMPTAMFSGLFVGSSIVVHPLQTAATCGSTGLGCVTQETCTRFSVGH